MGWTTKTTTKTTKAVEVFVFVLLLCFSAPFFYYKKAALALLTADVVPDVVAT